jgi:4-alpha-glucanotransferase
MKRRGSGILLHITSLPSPFGVGDFGSGAYQFADFLFETKQTFWQILPLTPTSPLRENSPYSSPSAFAGNPLLIDLGSLVQEGLLTRSDLEGIPSFSRAKVNYPAVIRYKIALFEEVYQNFKKKERGHWEFDHFCRKNAFWLEDYAFFTALKAYFGKTVWNRWPKGIRDRKPEELRRLKETLKKKMEIEKFLQYLFFKQWFLLKGYCNRKGIQIIGDVPIYVSFDSADVWAHPEIFKLDSKKDPLVVAGIPPDYFSSTGQLWGNPIYRWEVLKEKDYDWWIRRISHNLKFYDMVRLDHFKGFVDFWEVPAKERTAVKGRWVKGPGEDFFHALLKHFPYLPFIAEDLGVITPEVHALRDQFGFPGMRVLQFAFGNDPLADEYKPLNYIRNCVAYTGTHDNDTLISWICGKTDYSTRKPDEIRWERRNALNYLGHKGRGRKDIHWEFIRLLMMSVANLVIVPMQDLLGLGEEGRMNRPAKAKGNWEWKLQPKQLTPSLKRRLREMTEIYKRA